MNRGALLKGQAIEKGLRIIAPSIFPENSWSEAEALGAMVWLWNKHPEYRLVAVDVALESLLAIIRSKNFAIVVQDNKAIGYLNWAYLTETESLDYIQNKISFVEVVSRAEEEEGKQLWVLSWFVPSALNKESEPALKENLLMKTVARKHLFPKEQVFIIWHHSSGTKRVIKKFSGSEYKSM